MQVSDIMTKSVISAAPDTTVEQIVTLMLKHHISAVPILQADGKVVGIVSEGDLMRRVEGADKPRKSWWLSFFADPAPNAENFIRTRGHHAKDVMTRDVITVGPDMPVGEAARLLEKRRIKRVPVVENGAVVGLVSRANLLQALAAVPNVRIDSDADDARRREIVMGALAMVPGLDLAHLNVIVAKGRVDVWGIAGSDAEEAAAKVALENIDGIGEISVQLGRVPNYAWGI